MLFILALIISRRLRLRFENHHHAGTSSATCDASPTTRTFLRLLATCTRWSPCGGPRTSSTAKCTTFHRTRISTRMLSSPLRMALISPYHTVERACERNLRARTGTESHAIQIIHSTYDGDATSIYFYNSDLTTELNKNKHMPRHGFVNYDILFNYYVFSFPLVFLLWWTENRMQGWGVPCSRAVVHTTPHVVNLRAGACPGKPHHRPAWRPPACREQTSVTARHKATKRRATQSQSALRIDSWWWTWPARA